MTEMQFGSHLYSTLQQTKDSFDELVDDHRLTLQQSELSQKQKDFENCQTNYERQLAQTELTEK